MIDYLEELLDEQEQEEEQAGTPDMGAVFLPAGRRSAQGQTGTETVQKAAEGAETAEATDREAASAALTERTEGYLTAALKRQEGYLSPGQARSWAAGLYRETVMAGQAAGTLRQGSGRLLTVTEGAEPNPGLGAAELDEIFARDARRYDGGFSLY